MGCYDAPYMEGRNFNISITSGTVVKTILILGLAWLILQLYSVALIILTAVVIASAIEPGVHSLVRRKIPRVFAVLMIYLLMMGRSEEHTSELQSQSNLVCRILLYKKKR